MICFWPHCKRTDLVRWTNEYLICLHHQAVMIKRSKEHEQKFLVDAKKVNQEAHEVAVEEAGWVSPPQVRPYGDVHEVGGGHPSLGKGRP